LAGIPGVGTWTVETIAMRALGDPDAFPSSDVGVLHAARHLGIGPGDAPFLARAEGWRPWRAYAVLYLWSTIDHDVNRWPVAPHVAPLVAEGALT
jgi:AraC family transcriptional regulator of adaptative response / DNA-3-methyladenine glycosylase II